MDLSALRQMIEAIPEDQKRMLALDLLKWLAGKAWKRLTKSEKTQAKAEISRIVVLATMDDVKEYDPNYGKVVRAAKYPPAKKAPLKGPAVKKAAKTTKPTRKSTAKKVPRKVVRKK